MTRYDLIQALQEGRIDRRTFVRRALGMGLGIAGLGPVLAGCGRDRQDRSEEELARPLGPIEDQVNIYNWSDYVAAETIAGFEREFGVKVTYDTYESNEEMLAKLQAGAAGYDIVVPSGYAVPVLTGSGLVRPLHRELLTNFDNLSPLFLGTPADPENRYSVPWQWGTTGIAYRTDLVGEAPTGWGVFQDPRYRGKMTMMDDGREVLGAFLRFNGHSINSRSPAELDEARDDAILARDQLRAWISAPVKDQLIAGDVWIAQLWNGDTAQARTAQPALAYILPREGSAIWLDSLVIPRTARHPRAAHEFINYILRPEVAAAISDFTGYGSPNARARPARPVPYPSSDELARLEYQVDLGEATELWDRAWTEIKSGG